MLNVYSVAQYEAEAEFFMNGPLCATCRECNRPQGGRARFDYVSQRYGAVSAWGHIATYMVLEPILHYYPTNWEYYISRCA